MISSGLAGPWVVMRAAAERPWKETPMTIKAATPYLITNGKSERAIALYTKAFDAKVETIQRFGDVMGSCSEAQKSRVMHAVLRLGDAVVMMSDGPDAPDATPSLGPVCVALDLDDEPQARRSFDALAATGKTVEPLRQQPWGAVFGVVEDELGIRWMFHYAKKPA
jgi:PhnB protein